MTTPAHSVLTRTFLQSTVAKLKPRTAHCLPVVASLQDALRLFEMAHAGSVLVLEDSGQVAGIFTERDLVMKLAQGVALDSIAMPEVMTSNVQTIRSNASIARLMNLVALGGFRHVPVIGGSGEEPRMISARDIISFIHHAAAKAPTESSHADVVNLPEVARFLSSRVSALHIVPAISISSKATLWKALEMMRAGRTGCLVVSAGEISLAGIITERDLALRAVGKGFELERTRVLEIMTNSPVTIEHDAPLSKAFSLMAEGGYRHLPVTSNGRLSGVIGIKGLIKALTQSVIEELQSAT